MPRAAGPEPKLQPFEKESSSGGAPRAFGAPAPGRIGGDIPEIGLACQSSAGPGGSMSGRRGSALPATDMGGRQRLCNACRGFLRNNANLSSIAASGYDICYIAILGCTREQSGRPNLDGGTRMEFTKPPLQPDGEEAARYIAALAHELRTVAARANLGFVAYLLAMVEDEAAANARKRAGEGEGA